MKSKNTNFYCFSPPVMIATFAIEVSLLLYVLIRYKMTTLTRLVSAILLLLATFQYAEFQVCEAIGATDLYSRIGYVAITMLPPAGLHLVSAIAGKTNRRLIFAAYATGAAFALSFLLSPNAFSSYACYGNYAVFNLNQTAAYLFSAYYYGWLLAGIILCLTYRRRAAKKIKKALDLQALGYISFMLPTGVVNLLNPTTIEGIPSIMCGFAVIYALILVFSIVPLILREKQLAATSRQN